MTSNSYKYKKDFYDKRRKQARSRLGGVCVVCGINEDLQFDHIDPMTKVFDITQGLFHNAEIFWAEVEKCQLLCRPHHELKTGEEQRIRHGNASRNKARQCQCEDCKDKARAYRRAWRQNRRNQGLRPT